MDEFLEGPDEEGIDHLDLEIESLEIWKQCGDDGNYFIDSTGMTWRQVASHLAERGIRLARLLKEVRDDG